MCSPGEFFEEFHQHVAGSTITVVPDDFEFFIAAVPVLQEAGDVGFADVFFGDAAFGFRHYVADGGAGAEVEDGWAEEWLFPQHHFEAVIVGRVVAAGHHYRAVGVFGEGGEVEHRGGAAGRPR